MTAIDPSTSPRSWSTVSAAADDHRSPARRGRPGRSRSRARHPGCRRRAPAKDDFTRVVEDLAGVAVVGVHVERAALLPAERLVARPTGLGEVAPRRLRGIPDDGPRRRPTAPRQHPPLHRREVLGLVDEHVGVTGGPVDAAHHQPLAGVGRRDLGLGLLGGHPAVDAGTHVDDTPLRELVELLDVVEADVLAVGPLHGAEPRDEVVDERRVGHRPGAGLERLAVGVTPRPRPPRGRARRARRRRRGRCRRARAAARAGRPGATRSP